MLSYSYFADFYDELTQNVNYEEEAHYILKLAERYRHNMGITLDLACGTGTLTIMLKKLGVDIYGIGGNAFRGSGKSHRKRYKRYALFKTENAEHRSLRNYRYLYMYP